SDIQSGIADDPQQPGLERAAALERMQMGECLDETFLDGVQGVGFVTEEAIGDAISQAAVTVEKFFQRLPFAVGQAGEQMLITGGRQSRYSHSSHGVAGTPQEQTTEQATLFR